MRNTRAGGGSSQSGLSKTDGGLRRRSLDTARHRTAWRKAGPEEAPVRFGWGTRSVQMKKGPPQRINRGRVWANCVEAFESFGVEPLPYRIFRMGTLSCSEGKGHTFESCRVRQFFPELQRDVHALTGTSALLHLSEQAKSIWREIAAGCGLRGD